MENHSNLPFSNENNKSSAVTIAEQQAKRLRQVSQQKRQASGKLMASLEDPHNVVTSENSIMRDPLIQMYPTNNSHHFGPEKGAQNSARYHDNIPYPSTIKRRPHNESLSETGAGDEDEDEMAEIGTHRKESNHNSQQEFTGVNRFNGAT